MTCVPLGTLDWQRSSHEGATELYAVNAVAVVEYQVRMTEMAADSARNTLERAFINTPSGHGETESIKAA